MKDFKDYDRHPILLSNHAVALIQIYSKTYSLDDLWKTELDFIKRMSEEEGCWEKAAKQFCLQLEGSVAPKFYRALKKEIENYLIDLAITKDEDGN